MQTQTGSAIGDLVAEDNLLWVDNSYIYTNSVKNSTDEFQNIFALGFENYEDTIENEIESSNMEE